MLPGGGEIMSVRRWAERVQSEMAARRQQAPRGRAVARRAITLAVGFGGTAALLLILFSAPTQPAPGPLGQVVTRSPATTPAPSDLHRADAKAAAPKPVPAPTSLQPPVPGRVLVPFGWAYSKTLADWRLHGGLSLSAPDGEPVAAAAAGTVTAVRRDPPWGLVVTVDDGGGMQTEYAGLGSFAVKVGERVAAGDTIGTAGHSATIESALGPHLYFAVIENGRAVDPQPLLTR